MVVSHPPSPTSRAGDGRNHAGNNHHAGKNEQPNSEHVANRSDSASRTLRGEQDEESDNRERRCRE